MITNTQEFNIAVIPGDGIGKEIMSACAEILRVLSKKHGVRFHYNKVRAGAEFYTETGTDITDEDFTSLDRSDAILLGAIGHPEIRWPDGTEIAPHLRIRTEFGLIAGLRPIKAFPGLTIPLSDPRARDIDIVIIRESTEGLFASRGKGCIKGDMVATETLVITRKVCEPLFDEAFRLARQRRNKGSLGRVTCVDKSNVFTAMAFFRKIFDERALLNPDLIADYSYVDAAALDLVRKPWEFDVMVMENMFGDILSDLGAGIVGGMGFAPCAELGPSHALFQPAHGTAPDIAGQDKANPTAMFLSAKMMLDWLGERHDVQACRDAADDLASTIERCFSSREIVPLEIGGSDGTTTYTKKVLAKLS